MLCRFTVRPRLRQWFTIRTVHGRQTLTGRPQYSQWKITPRRSRHCDERLAGNHLRVRFQRRQFSLSSIPTLLLPPVVFTGLLITLWTYKCLMMIIFQNKIIYMPSMPPFSRSEKVEDYASACRPIEWVEHSLKSRDGIALKLLEGKVPPSIPDAHFDAAIQERNSIRRIVVLYFQGNGSSLPPRLPYLSNILKRLKSSPTANTSTTKQHQYEYTIIALSYRGFWKSKGHPSQRGIELDAQAALNWAAERYRNEPGMQIVLWGQSIGAGVATTALATWQDQHLTANPSPDLLDGQRQSPVPPVTGLLLETPFTSLRAMLISLYPQKFLPYRYLGPFLMSTWDSVNALARIGAKTNDDENIGPGGMSGGMTKARKLKILLLEAENDELVPKEDATTLYQLCRKFEQRFDIEHRVVSGALHTDVMFKGNGKMEVVRFLRKFEE